MNRTAEIVDTWFKHQHEEVIEKLRKTPTLQLEYVLRVLTDKDAEISRMLPSQTERIELFKENSMLGKESEEYTRYYKILTLNIELLCDYRPEDVMTYVRKKWYPTQLCLEICKRKNHQEAVAYLLKRSGELVESLNCYIGIMAKVGEQILDEGKKNVLSQSALEFRKYFDRALKVCKKHAKVTANDESEQGPWFTLLDHLYNSWLKMHRQQGERGPREAYGKTVPANTFITTLNECIKSLLGSMMESVSFPTILTRVTQMHGELEIDSFKDIFTSMLHSYFYQEKILETARCIVSTGLVKQFQLLNCVRSRGIFLKTTVCARCEKPIPNKSEEEATTYPCGHIYHSLCVKPKEQCPACARQGKSMLPD